MMGGSDTADGTMIPPELREAGIEKGIRKAKEARGKVKP
jgi:hypothetical protein